MIAPYLSSDALGELERTLRARGFTPDGPPVGSARPRGRGASHDAATWRSGDELVLRRRGRWLELVAPRAHAGPVRPGPWKPVGTSEVCDLPPDVVDGELLAEALDWALAARAGTLAPSADVPTADELRAWVPADALVVRSGRFLARGQVQRTDGTLALAFDVPGKGPRPEGGRRAWVSALLDDAQARWRLVRFRPVEADTAAVRAEVDLSGVPDVLAEPMVRAALSGLAWVVGRVLAPLSLLLDEGVRSDALEHPPHRASEIHERILS